MNDIEPLIFGQGLAQCPCCSAPLCAYCGGPATHRDHVRPRINGGPGGANVVDACRTCNLSKNSTPVARWLLTVLTDAEPDERRQRIIERLRSGEIAERLGPPQLGWQWPSDPDYHEDPPPSTLAACIIEIAACDLDEAGLAIRNKKAAVAAVFGEDWLQTVGWWEEWGHR